MIASQPTQAQFEKSDWLRWKIPARYSVKLIGTQSGDPAKRLVQTLERVKGGSDLQFGSRTAERISGMADECRRQQAAHQPGDGLPGTEFSKA